MKQHFNEWVNDMACALTDFAQEYRSNALADDFVGWEHEVGYFEEAFKLYLEKRA